MNYQRVILTPSQRLYDAQNSNPCRPQMAPHRESRACRKAGAPDASPFCAFSNPRATRACPANRRKAPCQGRASLQPDAKNSRRIRPKHCVDAQLCRPDSGRRRERLGGQVWEARELKSVCPSADSGPRAGVRDHNRACELGHYPLRSPHLPSQTEANSALEHQKYVKRVCEKRAYSAHARPLENDFGAMALDSRPSALPSRASSL